MGRGVGRVKRRTFMKALRVRSGTFVGLAGRLLPILRHAGRTKFIYAALLDAPQSFAPDEHYHWEERLHWAAPNDDLPKHEGTISELKGEGNDQPSPVGATDLDTQS